MALTKEEWGKNNELVLKEYAEKISQKITIRDYPKGSSRDTTRATTMPEKEIIKNIIFSALLAIRGGGDIQTAADTAEFIGMQFLREANSYLTFYNPIKFYQW